MGVVRGELVCDFTASFIIVENRNNSLLLLKMCTREKYLYRLAVFIPSGNGCV